MQISATGKPQRRRFLQGRCCPTKNHQGFTLLEVMVVMVLIGVLSSSLVLTFSNDSPPPLQQTRERLQRFSLQLYEQAVLRNQLLALVITSQGEVQAQYYQRTTAQNGAPLTAPGRWQQVTDSILAPWQLPADIHWSLSSRASGSSGLDTHAIDKLKVLFNPQGLVSPFLLTLHQKGQADQQFDDRFFYPQIQQSTKE